MEKKLAVETRYHQVHAQGVDWHVPDYFPHRLILRPVIAAIFVKICDGVLATHLRGLIMTLIWASEHLLN